MIDVLYTFTRTHYRTGNTGRKTLYTTHTHTRALDGHSHTALGRSSVSFIIPYRCDFYWGRQHRAAVQ